MSPAVTPAITSAVPPAGTRPIDPSIAPVPAPVGAQPAAFRRERLLAAPEALHPALWRAQGGGRSAGVRPSGFARLDAELPGGGWPLRALTELLLPRAGVGEIRLLAPALAALVAEGRSLMLFEPPAQVSAEGLAQLGLPVAACVVVRSQGARQEGDLCWALEQALRSGQLGAVLAWPGARIRPEMLRRLQLAAQAHEGPAFLMRELAARQRPSPAPLRLALQPAGPDALGVQILKRRGPALAWPLRLSLPAVLSERALALALSPLEPARPLPRERHPGRVAHRSAAATT
jgi:protein ImuA